MNEFAAESLAASSTAPHVRKAALLLYALDPTDRSWVLDRLSQEEREALVCLLEDLRVLGIPADPALLREFVAETNSYANKTPRSSSIEGAVTAPLESPGTQGPPDPRQVLHNANPATLAQILRGEPCMLIVRLLQIEAWPWHEALLKQFGPVLRRDVTDRLARITTAEVPAALNVRLMSEIATRLGALPFVADAAPLPAQLSKLSRRRKRVFGWLRGDEL